MMSNNNPSGCHQVPGHNQTTNMDNNTRNEECFRLSSLLAKRLDNKLRLSNIISAMVSCCKQRDNVRCCDFCPDKYMCGKHAAHDKAKHEAWRLQTEIEMWTEYHFADIMRAFDVERHHITPYVDAYTRTQMEQNGFVFEGWQSFLDHLNKKNNK